MTISIGRSNGPSTDLESTTIIASEELNIVKDVIAMVNSSTNNKEGWYIRVDNKLIVPKVNS